MGDAAAATASEKAADRCASPTALLTLPPVPVTLGHQADGSLGAATPQSCSDQEVGRPVSPSNPLSMLKQWARGLRPLQPSRVHGHGKCEPRWRRDVRRWSPRPAVKHRLWAFQARCFAQVIAATSHASLAL